MTVTNQLANLVISHTYRNVPFTSPSSIDVGLLDPDGNELVKLGYARVNETDFVGEPVNGVSVTTKDVIFPVAEEEWQVAYVALYDETGDLYQYGAFGSFAQTGQPVVLNAGKALRIPAGALSLSFGEVVPDGLWRDGTNTGQPKEVYFDANGEVAPPPQDIVAFGGICGVSALKAEIQEPIPGTGSYELEITIL